jgi:hypothetical protein
VGALWKFFSGEDDVSNNVPHTGETVHQRTSMWGFITGQHGDTCRLGSRGMTERQIEHEATAYHEAGHGRAACKGGFIVGGMWANPDGSGLTKADGAVRDDRSLRAYLVTLIAGQESEIRYLMDRRGYSRAAAERRTHHGASGDRALFAEAAAGTGYTWNGLQDEARRLVKWQAYTIETNARPLARRGRRGGTWA